MATNTGIPGITAVKRRGQDTPWALLVYDSEGRRRVVSLLRHSWHEALKLAQEIRGGVKRDPDGWLGYKPHRDDYADHGPKPSSETGKVSKRTEGRHNTAAQYLIERDELHPGDEIKTSVDSLRSILGAAAHMHMTHVMDDRPLGTLHVFRGVTKEVSDYILDTFGIDVLAYEGVEGT